MAAGPGAELRWVYLDTLSNYLKTTHVIPKEGSD